jgi:hypothetical protein
MSDSRESTSGHTPVGSHYQPSIGVVITILVLFVGLSFYFLRSSNAGTSTTTTVAGATTTTTAGSTTKTTLPRGKVHVQVANGTSVSGLAGHYTQLLTIDGWATLTQLNSSKVSSTIIYYNPGFGYAATEIASEIGVPSSAIQPLNGLTPVANAQNDNVIVILGPNTAIHG